MPCLFQNFSLTLKPTVHHLQMPVTIIAIEIEHTCKVWCIQHFD